MLVAGPPGSGKTNLARPLARSAVCARDLALARDRTRCAERHRGDLDAERTDEELWNEQHLEPLGLGPLIEVDTSSEIDVAALTRRLAAAVVAAPAAD